MGLTFCFCHHPDASGLKHKGITNYKYLRVKS
jgi:hypothetical protein